MSDLQQTDVRGVPLRWVDYEINDTFNEGFMAVTNHGWHPEHSRRWFYDLAMRYRLHPVVDQLLRHGYRPVDWQQLLLEWPHVSEEDETQLAYTRDENKGRDNVQTRTSVGKYLSRHWPHIPDHVRRDFAGAHNNFRFEFWDTKEGIISGIELGPRSCMQSGYGSIPFQDREGVVAYHRGVRESEDIDWHHHPYICYAPEYGWRMAVRIDPGRPDIVMGRALVYEPEKMFVRSYARNPDGESFSSGSDEKLEHWLSEQGYSRGSSWPEGAKLLRVEHPHGGGTLVPYIDGNVQRVRISKNGYLVIDDAGDLLCDNTDGTASEDDRPTCDDCEARMDEDDATWVGRNDDRCVCDQCRYRNYTFAIGSRDSYYVRDDDTITVGDESYVADDLPDYIVWVESQDDYMHIDDVVFVDGEYYTYEDAAIVCCYDGKYRMREDCVECDDGDWRPRDECWQDEHTEKWYSNDVTGVELNDTYHPDTLRQLAEENE